MSDNKPGTYHPPAELEHEDTIAVGANRDLARVVGVSVMPDDRVMVVLDVPADALFMVHGSS